MKFFLLSAALTIAAFTGFSEQRPAQKIKVDLIENYNDFCQETNQLVELNKSESADWEVNRKQFFKTRIAYKKIELFMAYMDPQFVKDHINGAPLLHIERKAPNLVILEPTGFQAMEEALLEEDAETFFHLAEDLSYKSNEFAVFLKASRLSERMVFEAMRESLIRLAAMGITGFDTPAEVNALAECEAVSASIYETVQAYYSYLPEDDSKEIDDIFESGDTFFKTDFAEFDRYNYIKDFVNPLYKKLYEVHVQLQIETKALVFMPEGSVNYEVVNLFDTDLLNYKYFSKYSNTGVEDERIALGQLLFFDPILSHNNQRACASCHQPEKGFADGRPTSIAFDGEGVLDRNSPGLINSIYNTRFFWDARAETPEAQIEHVLFNPKEFNTSYAEIITKLESCEEYNELFEAAYPEIGKSRGETIGRYTIVASIAAYIQSLRSFNSAFDKSMKGEAKADPRMVNGFNLFTGKAKCATCHFTPTFAGNVPPHFTDTETEVLGVPDTNIQALAILDEDQGRYGNHRPKEKADFYKHSFKTPTVRNIALTAPYMHNGVFPTLKEVVEFYNVGGGHGWGIAPEHTTLPEDSLHLTEKEIDDLIFFMESLTDTAGLTAKPKNLPKSAHAEFNNRVIGGLY